jgi:chemotaxis signal transduction protein
MDCAPFPRAYLIAFVHCRNRILGLWSKDVSRILPLADCGITETPSQNESPRASLIRQIYEFLDQSVSCVTFDFVLSCTFTADASSSKNINK